VWTPTCQFISLYSALSLTPSLSPRWRSGHFQGHNKRVSLSKPRLSNVPTNQWQRRLTSRNPHKRGQSRPQIMSRLWTFIHCFHSTLSSTKQHFKTTQGTSRRKKLCSTARPRCLVDRALYRPAEHHARMAGHDASETGRFTSRHSTLPSGTQPSNYTSSSCCSTPWTYDQPTTHPVYLFTTADRTPLRQSLTLLSDIS